LAEELAKHMTPLSAVSVCAVFVTYFPDVGFVERLRQLVPQVAKVVIIDNTSAKSSALDMKRLVDEFPQVAVVENRANKGIAAALNQGLDFAASEGYEWILTLDQDTRCHPEMVPTLLRVSETCQPKPLVIGSNYFDPQANKTKVPNGHQDGDYLEQKTVITSGSLIDVRMARSIGGFREDFFIDQVDHEFCLRARAHGHVIVISRKPVMTHSVGRLGGVRLPFLGILPNHPPVRKYYIARNTVVTVSNYWRTEPAWCARRLVRLLLGFIEMALLEQQRARKAYAFVCGVNDALHKQMGQCKRRLIN
jgi:rhamnosyltransferase